MSSMDFINELFGSEVNELKAHAKVTKFRLFYLWLRIDRRRNQEVLHPRGPV